MSIAEVFKEMDVDLTGYDTASFMVVSHTH